MKAALLLFLIWKACLAEGNEDLYQHYYSEEFLSFVEEANSNNHTSLIWQIFNNLEIVNSTVSCSQELKQFRKSMLNHDKWAIEFIDSSGSTDTGWLSGNTISLGDYKQCIFSTPKNFSSSYCLVNVDISKNKKQTTSWIPFNVPIIFSLCVPSACQSRQLEQILKRTTFLNKTNITVECQSARPGLNFGDGLIISAYIVVWVLILSTTIPMKWIPFTNGGLLEIWNSFSIHKNLSGLLKTNDSIDLLSSLHGIRVLSQCFIIWYHIIRSEMLFNYPVLNKFYFDKFFRSWRGAIEVELVLAVDTFFLIGGILLTWNCLKKKQKFNLLEYYTHRYLRLTPPYLATLLVVSTFASKLCDGPLCSYLIDKEKQSCASYWWTNIIYINNFYPGLLKSCMPHSWYLAADWQLFFFVSPFVVIVINKWPDHLLKLIAVIFLTSIISTFAVTYLYQLPTENLMFTSNMEASVYYNKLYAAPYSRAGPWAIGMLFGVVLYNFKNNPVDLSKNSRLLAWMFTIVGLCLSVEIDLPFLRQTTIGKKIWKAMFNTAQKNIWAASVCWLIFSSGTQKAGFVGKFLCWPGFQPLAKVSYSAYLIHKVIISLYFGETSGYRSIAGSNEIPLVLGIIFLTYLSALLLYLSFEAPILHIEKIIFRRDNTSLATQSRIGIRETSLVLENSNKDRIAGQDKGRFCVK